MGPFSASFWCDVIQVEVTFVVAMGKNLLWPETQFDIALPAIIDQLSIELIRGNKTGKRLAKL